MSEELLIGNTVRELRSRLKMTQLQLADATGLKRLTISQIESGYRGISTPNLSKLAKALKVPVSYLHLLSDESEDPLVKRFQQVARKSLGLPTRTTTTTALG